MTETIDRVRAHYEAPGLVDRIKAALAPITSEGQQLTVAQLAIAELAGAVELKSGDCVLDLGCGVGGPARYLASTFGCQVTGVDLSPSFIEAADYLTARCGLEDQVTFRVGDALHVPFDDGSFDSVFLQHVAMNIADRAALYAEVYRVLKRGGRLATYDLLMKEGDVVYPAPWARDASTSFLLSAEYTRATLEDAGFTVTLWRDDTKTAMDWFKAAMASPPPAGLNLGVIMGPEFQAITGNLGRNIREGRLGVLSAVLTRD